MKALIEINNVNNEQRVSARELHEFLDVNTQFNKWIERMLEYGFEEGLDFWSFLTKTPNGRPRTDFWLTLDCAKEIAMIQRNEKGKQARKYFIEVEKKAREAQKHLTPAEQLLHNAELLVAQERKLQEHNERLSQLEAKTTTRPDYFTVAGYGSLIGVPVNIKLASQIGRRASQMCKDRNLPMDSCPDPRFGQVRMYPRAVLEEAFEKATL
jgi:phage anti-repressor protein